MWLFRQCCRRTPVFGILRDDDLRALGPGIELERAGSDRLFLVGPGAFRRDDHRITPAHIIEKIAVRLFQSDLDGQWIHNLHRVDGGKQTLLRICGFVAMSAIERKLDVLGIECRAVVEFYVLVQLEGVDLAVVRTSSSSRRGQGERRLSLRSASGPRKYWHRRSHRSQQPHLLSDRGAAVPARCQAPDRFLPQRKRWTRVAR